MVDQVSQALGGLAQTIGTGLRGIASQRIAGAELGLRTAESGLRTTQAQLTIGSMRRKEFEEKQKAQHLSSPININMLVGRADEIALPDIITDVVPRWERIFDARLDSESGQFIKADGTPVTNRELRQKSGPVVAEFLASVDIGTEFEKNDVRLGIGIEQAETRGDTGLAQELQSKRVTNQQKIDAHADNPIPRWQKQLDALTTASVRFGNVADISGVNARIKTLQNEISDERERQRDIEIAGLRAGTTGGAKPFTLSPGQKRFDAEGNLVTEVDPKDEFEKPFTLRPGEKRFGAEGKEIAAIDPEAEDAKDFTLSPGQKRFGPSGTEIAAVTKPEDTKPLSPIGKLMFDRDKTSIGDDDRAKINEKIENEMNKGSGLTGTAKEIFDITGEKPTTVKQIRDFKRDTAVLTKDERNTKLRKEALPKIQAIPPNEAYERGWKMNDDGTVFTELDTGAPVRLPSFEKVMGKRGMTKAVLAAGEHADDAKEVQALMADPDVARALNSANNAGMWDLAKGAWSNKMRGWLQKKGLATNSKVTETVIRIGRLASRSRKEFLGTAVTANELRTVQSWLPSIGDSFDLMLRKIGVAADESDEIFTRFLDVFKNQANMSPFYNAFGIDRFQQKGSGEGANVQESQEIIDLKAKFGLE